MGYQRPESRDYRGPRWPTKRKIAERALGVARPHYSPEDGTHPDFDAGTRWSLRPGPNGPQNLCSRQPEPGPDVLPKCRKLRPANHRDSIGKRNNQKGPSQPATTIPTVPAVNLPERDTAPTPIRITPPVALAKAQISLPRSDGMDRLNSEVNPSPRAIKSERVGLFTPS